MTPGEYIKRTRSVFLPSLPSVTANACEGASADPCETMWATGGGLAGWNGSRRFLVLLSCFAWLAQSGRSVAKRSGASFLRAFFFFFFGGHFWRQFVLLFYSRPRSHWLSLCTRLCSILRAGLPPSLRWRFHSDDLDAAGLFDRARLEGAAGFHRLLRGLFLGKLPCSEFWAPAGGAP